MPPGWEQLLNYGVLGIGAASVLWFAYHTMLYLFSRDEKRKGYVSEVIEAHLANQKAQKELYSALVIREDRQQHLCEEHATLLGEHNECAQDMCGNISKLKSAAREACQLARTLAKNEWPNSVLDVERHCVAIERTIDEA